MATTPDLRQQFILLVILLKVCPGMSAVFNILVVI